MCVLERKFMRLEAARSRPCTHVGACACHVRHARRRHWAILYLCKKEPVKRTRSGTIISWLPWPTCIKAQPVAVETRLAPPAPHLQAPGQLLADGPFRAAPARLMLLRLLLLQPFHPHQPLQHAEARPCVDVGMLPPRQGVDPLSMQLAFAMYEAHIPGIPAGPVG